MRLQKQESASQPAQAQPASSSQPSTQPPARPDSGLRNRFFRRGSLMPTPEQYNALMASESGATLAQGNQPAPPKQQEQQPLASQPAPPQKPQQAAPVESKPAEAKPVETKPLATEAKPASSAPAGPGQLS